MWNAPWDCAMTPQTISHNHPYMTDIGPRSLLDPIGDFRSRHIHPSKRKREKKRKRKAANVPDKHPQTNSDPSVSAPEPPEIQKYVTIGFNSTTRYLERLARVSDPRCLGEGHSAPIVELDHPRPMAAILVPRLDQPPIMHAHLPLLVKAVSLASPESPSPCLVTLPKGAEERLKCAVGLPHIGLVGLIEGAPDARSAIELMRQSVPDVEVHWLGEARIGRYKPVNIEAFSTTAAHSKKGVPSRASQK